MKKIVIAFLCGALFFSGVSYAAEEFVVKSVKVKNYKIILNGEEVTLKNKPLLINNGTTYLPVREVAELTNHSVEFDGTGEGVITLTSIENENVIEESNSNKNLTTNDSDEFVFAKLPQTKEKDGVVITVHSITITETSTDFEVTVTNNREDYIRVYFTHPMRANHNVSGKEAKVAGTINDKDFEDIILAGETKNGIIQKGNIDVDSENVIFNVSINGPRDIIPFYINLK